MTKPQLHITTEPDVSVCGEPKKKGGLCTRPTDGGPCFQHGGDLSDGRPSAPAGLGKSGRTLWDYYTTRFHKADRLVRLDLMVLRMAAQIEDATQLAWESVQEMGILVQGRGDEVKKNPALGQHSIYLKESRQFAKQLNGMLGTEFADAGDLPAQEKKGIQRFL